jgi:signal transduction histidine kinase
VGYVHQAHTVAKYQARISEKYRQRSSARAAIMMNARVDHRYVCDHALKEAPMEGGGAGMDDACNPVDGLREACHDIRQSIAGVLALAGAALVETELKDDTRNRLQQIIGLAEWQADVVGNWLEVTASGSAPAGHTDVVRVVNKAAATERLTWTGDMTLTWPPQPVFTWLHYVILRRMAANLLSNATRAAGPSGTVAIEVSGRNGQMLLAVEDDGPGFGRLAGDHGLGLSAVARQAILHGGKLECGRGSLGGGRVSLWLPLAAGQAEGSVADATCPV